MFKLETKKKLHIFYLVISIVLTVTTYFYLKFSFFNYELQVNKRYIRESEVVQKIYFDDLDQNGESERFELHYLKDIKRNMLLCYNSDDILMEQFYLDGVVRKEWIHFDDWDEDGNRDIVLMHVNNDSLYCDVIDVLGRKYLVKNLFISEKDKRNNSSEWFFYCYPVLDNSTNRKLMYLSISTGYGIYPRSIFLIDRKKLKVLNRFDSTAPIEKAYLADLNHDNHNEYVALTKATGNDFIKKGYHDFTSWLLIFNDSLKFYQEPKKINRYPGQSFLYQLNYDKNEFLLYTNEINLPRVHSTLTKYDENFHKENSIVIENGVLFPVVNVQTKLIFTAKREGLLSVYDYDLQLKRAVQIEFDQPNLVKKIAAVDINSDNSNELLVFVDGAIRIYDQFLNLLTVQKSDYILKDLNDDELIASYKSAHGNSLVIPSESSIWVYSLVNNYFISNLIFFLPFILFVYFFMILLSGKAFAFISGYINVFNYFVKISDQGMMLLTNTGKIKKINNSFVKLLLLEDSNYLGKDFRKVLKSIESVSDQINVSIKYSQNSENDLTFRRGDNYFNGKVRVTVFRSFLKYPYAYLVEVIDYSKSLLEDRYKIWSKTSQKIAHDIKTPLSTILLNLKSLQYRLDKDDIKDKSVYNEDLTIIHNELDRIKNLTRNFLKFTNSERPNFTSLHLESIIKKSLQQFESYLEDTIELKIELKDDCHIYADENQMEQLFHILFENAIDAINEKGYLRITAEEMEEISTDSNVCLIEITDNGKGIPKEIIDKIFEPYFTTKSDGTGMGLAIGKKIVDDHKGKLEFYSHNNLGTTVKLTLPLG